MPAVSDYTVTYGRGPSPEAAIKALRANVHKGIAQGWEPIGGVATYVGPAESAPAEVVMVQAMVRPQTGAADG